MGGWLQIVGAVLTPNVGGILGALSMKDSVKNWYDKQIKKPSWRPPNKAFGLVWTYLYSTMGYSAYRVWMEYEEPSLLSPTSLPTPLKLFALQLVLNWIWTPIFFNYKQITLALFEIVLLDVTVGATLYTFWEVDGLAGALLVPYLGWLTIATALTASIWKNNPKWRFGPPSSRK